jgi:signal transduction histidine kinase
MQTILKTAEQLQMIIEAHRGGIEVHSVGEGKGSVFIVRLPCRV